MVYTMFWAHVEQETQCVRAIFLFSRSIYVRYDCLTGIVPAATCSLPTILRSRHAAEEKTNKNKCTSFKVDYGID